MERKSITRTGLILTSSYKKSVKQYWKETAAGLDTKQDQNRSNGLEKFYTDGQ